MAHELDRGFDAVEVTFDLRPITFVLEVLGPRVDAFGKLDVLGDVDHHRAGPSALGDMERLVQHARKVADVLHEIIVLGAGARDAHRVAFLKCVIADEVGWHLPSQAHQWRRVHEGVGEPGDGFGGAGTGGHQHAPHLAGRARITLGRVHRALLVPHQDVLDLLLLE